MSMNGEVTFSIINRNRLLHTTQHIISLSHLHKGRNVTSIHSAQGSATSLHCCADVSARSTDEQACCGPASLVNPRCTSGYSILMAYLNLT